MRTLTYLLTRVILAVGTIWLVSVTIFVAAEVIPRDPAIAALGRESTTEQRALFRERANLDDPPVERYARWVGGVLMHGDFGDSAITGNDVGSELFARTKYTAILAGASLLIGVLVALPLAVRAAQRAGSTFDVVVSSLAVGAVASPEFVMGIIVLTVFAVYLEWVPVISSGIAQGDLQSLVLPTITLALGVAAYVFRIARVSLQETLTAPYVRRAVLDGFSRTRIMWRHVMPNAGVVIVNAIALNAIYLIGGVIVIETLFSYPGLGSYLVQGIGDGDIILIEGIGVIMAALFVAINFIADGIVLALNPKLRAA